MTSSAASVYYRTLFPWPEYELLLSVPASLDCPALSASHRELSFRKGWRYLSGDSASEGDKSVRKLVCTSSPQRLDIGAFYTLPVVFRPLNLSEFQPSWVELRFDIDMTDYDNVRACTGRQLCKACLPLLKAGARALDYLLEKVFHFNDRLWCFSGGRGLHCWVLDPSAVFLTADQRVEISDFFRTAAQSLTHPDQLDKLPHQEELDVVYNVFAREGFDACLCKDRFSLRKGGLGDRVKEFIDRLAPELAARCRREWLEKRTPHWNPSEDWADLRKLMGKGPSRALIMGIAFPRIDYAVTRSINHMLRAPLSVREDNGNLVEPLDLGDLDSFDFATPLNSFNLDTARLGASIDLFRTVLRCRLPEASWLVCMHCLSSVSDLHLLERGCVFNSRVQFHLHVQTHHSAEPSPILDSCTVAAVASRIHTRNAPDQLTYKLSQRVKATYYEMLCELL